MPESPHGRVPLKPLCDGVMLCLSKSTFTLLATFAYKVKEEKTRFTQLSALLSRGLMQTSGVLPHLLSHSSIELLPFLKTLLNVVPAICLWP